MSPADVEIVTPSSDAIGMAVFSACKLEGEDPIAALQGRPASRGRLYAFLALAHRFPTANRAELGLRCGERGAAARARGAVSPRPAQWFSLDRLNRVCAACGWPAMTMGEAREAPLLYCGLAWRDFLPGAARACDAAGNPADVEWGPSPARPQESPAFIPDAAAEAPTPPASVRTAGPPPATVTSDAGPGGEQPPANQPAAARSLAADAASSPGTEGGKDPASDAEAKASMVEAPGSGDADGAGLRVGAAEGAQAPRDAGAGDRSRVDLGAETGILARETVASARKAGELSMAPKRVERPSRPSPLARVIDRRPADGDVTAALCGDPPPGRSALAQRGRP